MNFYFFIMNSVTDKLGTYRLTSRIQPEQQTQPFPTLSRLLLDLFMPHSPHHSIMCRPSCRFGLQTLECMFQDSYHKSSLGLGGSVI